MFSGENIKLLLDLGQQSISNRFWKKPDETVQIFSLKLWQCQETGSVHLIEPFKQYELIPSHE